MIYEKTECIFDKKNFSFGSILLSSIDNVDCHCHKETEIILLLSGEISVLANNKTHVLSAGDIFIIAPYMPHALLNPSNDCERIVYVVDFSSITVLPSLGEDVTPDLQSVFQQLETYSSAWPHSTKDKIIELLKQMYTEYFEKKKAWELAITILVSRFLLICIRELPERSEINQSKEIQNLYKIIRYIAAHSYQSLSLYECACEMGWSTSYLSRYFRKHMGISFQDYVKNSRIERAKTLLLSTDTSITEICYEAGFSGISTFNKLFKSEVGINPSQYRKKYSEMQEKKGHSLNYVPKTI